MRSGIPPFALYGKAAGFEWTKCCLAEKLGSSNPSLQRALFILVASNETVFGHRTVEPDFVVGVSLSFLMATCRERLRTIHLLQQDAGEWKVEIEGDRGGQILECKKRTGHDVWCASCIG